MNKFISNIRVSREGGGGVNVSAIREYVHDHGVVLLHIFFKILNNPLRLPVSYIPFMA